MNISVELVLVCRLKSLGVTCNAFDGLTTIDQRREKVRAAIKKAPLDMHPELEKNFRVAYQEAL